MDSVWDLVNDMLKAMEQMAEAFEIEHTRRPQIEAFRARAEALKGSE